MSSDELSCNDCKFVDRETTDKPCINCKRNARDMFKRRTNADKIRGYDDVTLAQFLYNVSNGFTKMTTCEEECDKCSRKTTVCVNQVVEWLRQ